MNSVSLLAVVHIDDVLKEKKSNHLYRTILLKLMLYFYLLRFLVISWK